MPLLERVKKDGGNHFSGGLSTDECLDFPQKALQKNGAMSSHQGLFRHTLIMNDSLFHYKNRGSYVKGQKRRQTRRAMQRRRYLQRLRYDCVHRFQTFVVATLTLSKRAKRHIICNYSWEKGSSSTAKGYTVLVGGCLPAAYQNHTGRRRGERKMLARRKTLIVIIMAFLMAVIGCQSEEEAPVEQTTRPEVAPQPETTARVEETTDPKVAFRETIQKQVAELERDIETLQAKAAEIPAERKEEFNQMMQSLQSQKEVVKERLEALKGGSLEEWETLKSGTEEALKELKNNYQNIANRFSS